MPKAGGGMWSLCVWDSSNLKTSFFEPSVSFLPLLLSTKLGCRHFWIWLVFVSTWLSPKTGKLLYRLGGFNRFCKGGLVRMVEDRTHKLSNRKDICTQDFSLTSEMVSNEAGPHPMSELLPHRPWVRALSWPGQVPVAQGCWALTPLQCCRAAPCVWVRGKAQRQNVICQNLLSFCDDMRNLCIFGFFF